MENLRKELFATRDKERRFFWRREILVHVRVPSLSSAPSPPTSARGPSGPWRTCWRRRRKTWSKFRTRWSFASCFRLTRRPRGERNFGRICVVDLPISAIATMPATAHQRVSKEKFQVLFFYLSSSAIKFDKIVLQWVYKSFHLCAILYSKYTLISKTILNYPSH